MNISCEFSKVSTNRANFYRCTVGKANIAEKRHVINIFNGWHKETNTHENVNNILFEGAVDYFPRELHKHFPNLTTLIIKKSDLKEISRNDLKGLEGLFVLEIEECKLTSLPDNLLTRMPRLREFSIRRNKIEFASSKLLEPLIGRKDVKVDLMYNKAINACFRPGEYGTLKSLEELMKLIDEKCGKPAEEYAHPKLKELWQSGRFSDISITAGDKKFKAHKTILLMQSGVFAQLIEDQDDATEIKIPDFSSNAVEALLKFIYTTEVTDDENARENFEIANKFKVDAMISKYEEIIIGQLDDSNALEIFLFAHRLSSQPLKEDAFDQIDKKFDEEISKKLPKKLMEDPEKMKKFLFHQHEMNNLLED